VLADGAAVVGVPDTVAREVSQAAIPPSASPDSKTHANVLVARTMQAYFTSDHLTRIRRLLPSLHATKTLMTYKLTVVGIKLAQTEASLSL
jgi:hypothetical protein